MAGAIGHREGHRHHAALAEGAGRVGQGDGGDGQRTGLIAKLGLESS